MLTQHNTNKTKDITHNKTGNKIKNIFAMEHAYMKQI